MQARYVGRTSLQGAQEIRSTVVPMSVSLSFNAIRALYCVFSCLVQCRLLCRQSITIGWEITQAFPCGRCLLRLAGLQAVKAITLVMRFQAQCCIIRFRTLMHRWRERAGYYPAQESLTKSLAAGIGSYVHA